MKPRKGLKGIFDSIRAFFQVYDRLKPKWWHPIDGFIWIYLYDVIPYVFMHSFFTMITDFIYNNPLLKASVIIYQSSTTLK